jgi:prevent-host-death family protein
MKIAPLADVKANLSKYIKASEEELVVVTRNGKPVAVLLSIEDEEELERLAIAYSSKFRRIIAEARRQIQETGGTRHEDLWQEFEGGTKNDE